jgi:hypothetical protein
MRILVAATMVHCVILALIGTAYGSESGNYPLGMTGLKNGTVPPPGIYLLNLDYFYRAMELKDKHGKEVTEVAGRRVNGEVDIFANMTGVSYVTDKNVFGATYSATLFTNFGKVKGDVTLADLNVSAQKFSYADMYVEPVNFSWHLPRFDLFVAYEFFAPTGAYDPKDLANVGRDRWEQLFSVGMTAYLDNPRKWAFSIVPRYEIPQHELQKDRTGGQDALLEWGLSRTLTFMGCDQKLPWGILDVGPVGYASWKTTNDTGSAAVGGKIKYSTYAAGAEAAITMVKWHAARFSLRYEREFAVRARTQGQVAVLSFAIKY